MCGIAGFTSSGQDRAQGATLEAMTTAIAHRGPDGSGAELLTAQDGRMIALGHRRLSIIDLVGGAQPFAIDQGRYTMTYNGEVYNYVELRQELESLGRRFASRSDTEVVLQAYAQWGEAAFGRMRGMFALAIWDSVQQRLVLARDPFGKKPLLYFRAGDDIVFGSEFAALVRHPDFDPALSEADLARYLIWKYVPGPRTLVRSVAQVPPGHVLIWQDGQIREHPHYTLPRQGADPAAQLPHGPDTVAGFRAALEDAVRLRLRSDVPLGAFLSGGIDSSAIVALMSQIGGQQVRTFSVGFEDEAYSELWAARLIAERYKTDHHEILISPEDFLDRLEEVTWARGAPLSEMADVPLHALSHLAAAHVKVVLSGEGADELLGGYPKHRAEVMVARAQAALPRIADGPIAAMADALPYRFRRAAIFARVVRERDFLSRQAAWFGLMGKAQARALAPGLFAQYDDFDWPQDPGAAAGPLARSLAFDKTVWLPGTLLERGDRMTMAASIEGRMPFMDTGLCAFAARLPPQAFLDKGKGKAILRAAMARDLPDAILNKPKAGFRVPIGDWLRGRLKDYAHARLFGAGSQVAALCDRAPLARLWDDHQSLRRNREKELWGLMSLDIFLDQLRVRTAPR